jgi:hypothetical protein
LDGLGAPLALGPFLVGQHVWVSSTHVRVFEKRPDIGAAAAADLGSSHRHPMQAS